MKETALRFEHGGRTYECIVESLVPRGGDGRGTTAARGGAWWWFAVTGDQQRYAPFRGAADDTAALVRDRIIAYYEHLIAQRLLPAVRRGGKPWGRPPAAAAGTAESAATEDAAPVLVPDPPA